MKDLEVSLYLGRSINEYGLENKKNHFKNFKGSKRSSRLSSKLNRLEFPLYASYLSPEIIHFTYYRDTNPFFKGYRFITVYDLIHEIFPEQFVAEDPTIRWKKQGLAKADLIISISESTKADLMKHFQIPEDRIKVIYLANSLFAEPRAQSPVSAPYLLFVGLRKGYKNFRNLLSAMAHSNLAKNMNLLAFGGPSFSEQELEFIKSCGLEGKVTQVSGNDLELATAYKHAAAFVFPSLYEGFGIPPLEAMNYGCPVLSSNVSSVPEIVGEGGLQVQADQIEELSAGIDKILGDTQLRASLIVRGKKRTLEFNWDRCAKEHHDLYISAKK